MYNYTLVVGYTKIVSLQFTLKNAETLQLRISWLSLQSTPAHPISSMISRVFYLHEILLQFQGDLRCERNCSK